MRHPWTHACLRQRVQGELSARKQHRCAHATCFALLPSDHAFLCLAFLKSTFSLHSTGSGQTSWLACRQAGWLAGWLADWLACKQAGWHAAISTTAPFALQKHALVLGMDTVAYIFESSRQNKQPSQCLQARINIEATPATI